MSAHKEPTVMMVVRELAGNEHAGPFFRRLMTDVAHEHDALARERDALAKELDQCLDMNNGDNGANAAWSYSALYMKEWERANTAERERDALRAVAKAAVAWEKAAQERHEHFVETDEYLPRHTVALNKAEGNLSAAVRALDGGTAGGN